MELLEFQAADGPGPVELAEANLERQVLVAGIADLTPDQQEVIAYRFFGGLSPAEIAEVMGKREGSVRALQFRALATLRRHIGGAELPRSATGEAPA